MTEAIWMVAQPVAILFVLMGVGFIAAKLKWLDGAGAGQMTAILLYVCTPCLILRSFENLELSPETMRNMLLVAVFAVIAHIAGIIPSFFLFRRDEPGRRSVLRMGAAFSNCAYMGIPVVSALLGPEAVAYAAVFIVVFNLFCWTYGVHIYKPAEKSGARALFLNPGVISLGLGLVILLTGVKMPPLIGSPMDMMGAVNAPAAMLIAGVHLASANLLPQKGDGRMWISVAFRLLFVPLLMLGFFRIAGLSGLWVSAGMVLVSAPSAAIVLLFSARFGADTPFAARLLAYCNLCSLITMPLIVSLI